MIVLTHSLVDNWLFFRVEYFYGLPFVIVHFQYKLFALSSELSFLSQLSIWYAMIKHVVKVEAVPVEELNGVCIEMNMLC